MNTDAWVIMKPCYIFFPRLLFIFLSLFCSFMVVWGSACWGLGFGVWGWSFQLIGFRDCGVGSSGVFWNWGALYKQRRMTLGKKLCDYESCEWEIS